MEKAEVKIINNYEKPKKAGFYYCLICLTGANKGLSYYFSGKRIVLGRSEDADIQVADGKSSREHAELTSFSNQYVVTDLGSHNGLYVNDLKVSQHHLVVGDNIVIGQTVYKYSELEIVEESNLAVSENKNEIKEINEDLEKIEKKIEKPKRNNKKLLIAGVVTAIVIMMIPSDGKKNNKRKPNQDSNYKEMTIEKPLVYEIEDRDVRDKLSAFIHRGQREYREGNYFRAIDQFEMALILVPNHGQASFYLRKSRDSLKDYIKQMEAKAEQETASLRYRAALNQYCSIISFLQNYKEDDRYKKAEKNISILEEKIGYESGEFKCY